MKVTELHIKTQAQYEPDAGVMKGIIHLTGANGESRLNLSAAAMSKIFRVIASEVNDTAKLQAETVSAAMQEAIHGPLLADMQEVGELA